MSLVIKDVLATIITRVERGMHVPVSPVSILAYHAVSNDKTIVDIEPAMFLTQINFLKKNFQFITLDQVINYLNLEKSLTRPAIALTFDDGYRDVFTTIAPILAQNNIPATAFVLSNPTAANRAELENNKELLSEKEIKTLQKLGWTIGCHTATHANLLARNVDLNKEITKAKLQLERTLQTPVTYFAYPKGFYTPHIIEQVKQAGFTAAFAFEAGFITRKTNRYAIPRIPVDATHSMEQFEALLSNWSKYYFIAKNKIQRSMINS